MLVPPVKFTVVMLLWLACFFVLISLSGKLCRLLKRVNLLKEENRDLRICHLTMWEVRIGKQGA